MWVTVMILLSKTGHYWDIELYLKLQIIIQEEYMLYIFQLGISKYIETAAKNLGLVHDLSYF